MTSWEAFFLGLIQGITEFLPISSSGHLELGQYFLGFQDLHRYIFFNLICHLGTLCAIVLMFRSKIKEVLTKDPTYCLQLLVATLPLVPLVFVLKPIKAFFDHPQYLGFCFILSGFLLFLGTYFKIRNSEKKTRSWTDSAMIGIFQAFAILPGISRSGSTISAAQLLGWKKSEAIYFSFLLAIPAILGGTILETFQLFQAEQIQMNLSLNAFVIGFFTSFFVGYLTLRLLLRIVAQDKWIYCAWYCLGLGLLTLIYFNHV